MTDTFGLVILEATSSGVAVDGEQRFLTDDDLQRIYREGLGEEQVRRRTPVRRF